MQRQQAFLQVEELLKWEAKTLQEVARTLIEVLSLWRIALALSRMLPFGSSGQSMYAARCTATHASKQARQNECVPDRG